MIPQGTYNAVAVAADVQWGEAQTGTKQVVIPFRIIDGEHAGRVLSWFGYFTRGTARRTMESLRYCGWIGDDLTDLGPLPNKVEIVVEHEDYDGKTRAKVAWVNQVGGGKIKLQRPMTDSELRAFAATMRAHAANVPEVEGEPATPQHGSTAAAAANDDLPF